MLGRILYTWKSVQSACSQYVPDRGDGLFKLLSPLLIYPGPTIQIKVSNILIQKQNKQIYLLLYPILFTAEFININVQFFPSIKIHYQLFYIRSTIFFRSKQVQYMQGKPQRSIGTPLNAQVVSPKTNQIIDSKRSWENLPLFYAGDKPQSLLKYLY